MGIKDLKKTIKKYAPGAIKEISFQELRGCTFAIDSSILLYKYRYIYREDNFHIMGFVSKIIELFEFGIKPIFVFDGAPPEAKKETLDKRCDVREKMTSKIGELKEQKKVLSQELPKEVNVDEFILSDDEDPNEIPQNVKELKKITKEINKLEKNILHVYRSHSMDVIELLKILGIPFCKAYSDAEQTCAYLQKNNKADYVFTEDTDTLVFGATKVIFGNFVYQLPIILEEMQLNYSQFVDFSILCGCDYTCTIPKVGPVTALQLIKRHGSLEEILNECKYTIPETFDYHTPRSIFKNENLLVTVEQFHLPENIEPFLLKWKIPDFLIKKLIFIFSQK